MNRTRQIAGYFFALLILLIAFFVITPLFFKIYYTRTLATHLSIQLKWWNIAVGIYILLMFLCSRGWRRFCLNLFLANAMFAWVVFGSDISLKLHFIGFSLFTLLIFKKFKNHRLNAALFVYSCAIGNELLQYYLPGRECQLWDLVSNCITVTFWIAWWLINLTRKERRELLDSMRRRLNSSG